MPASVWLLTTRQKERELQRIIGGARLVAIAADCAVAVADAAFTLGCLVA
jgi:hypothetical protein